jgi:hypothetical protein
MGRTAQQQSVIDAAKDPSTNLIKVEAVAGAGKTFTLVELAKELNPQYGIYMAYNKSIATEATEKFKGTNMFCTTLHALAYQATVKQYGLKIGYFGVRDVKPSSLPYKTRLEVATLIDEMLLSEYTTLEDFFNSIPFRTRPKLPVRELVSTHLDKMTYGEISCSHSFYLKLYHILLTTGVVEAPKCDLLMLDEAGDITPITLDIFKLIKSPKKVLVGDAMQNIYGFNNTINGFTALKSEGVSVPLTQSFRVSSPIAARIEAFCRNEIDSDMEFKGRDYASNEVVTKAFISRYNSELVEEMFKLQFNNVKFNTTRSIDTILELPLLLANLGNGKAIKATQYKFIEKLRKQWETTPALHRTYPTVQRYVAKVTSDDDEISRGFSVVYKHGPTQLNALAKYVRECNKEIHPLTLTTAHSSKGLEFDEVTIANDLNEVTLEAITELPEAEAEKDIEAIVHYTEQLRLYYVATSRAKVSLLNAKMLPNCIIEA